MKQYLTNNLPHPYDLQVARIQGYLGDTKVASVESWSYDKSWLEKTLDQDDENLPLVMPTSKSKYKIMYQAVNGKSVPLHIQGKNDDQA